ncbi:transposase [Streptomyces sp. NPDC048564]|uniref:transposase n=1 Tax=Streptomyces sp. NPDC048564 TaxID=3155760 RepID=UPI00341D6755
MQLSRCPLSLRPRSDEHVPPLTVQVARASNPGGTTAIWVRDRLDGLWCDEYFADWYPRDGRPGLSPAQLATVCVLQFLLSLSDRQAAEAVRFRIDFKYAMAVELDDPGFHHSVLADFRDGLAEGDRADPPPRLRTGPPQGGGPVRERTPQRTDSTHVLAAAGSDLLEELVDADWGRRYGRPVRRGKNPTKPKTRTLDTGTTPSGSWSTSTGAGQTARPTLASRPCARSWCRTTTATPQGTALAPPRLKAGPGCRPRPGRSSLPTTPRHATHGTDTSSAGRGSPLIWPRPALLTALT